MREIVSVVQSSRPGKMMSAPFWTSSKLTLQPNPVLQIIDRVKTSASVPSYSRCQTARICRHISYNRTCRHSCSSSRSVVVTLLWCNWSLIVWFSKWVCTSSCNASVVFLSQGVLPGGTGVAGPPPPAVKRPHATIVLTNCWRWVINCYHWHAFCSETPNELLVLCFCTFSV